MIITLVVYSVALLVRPLGCIVLGFLGDKYGRKKALAISIMIMAIVTSLIGVLPPYDVAGRFSLYILVILRLLQGFSAGGEFVSASLFMIENTSSNNKGFAGALIVSSSAFGFLIASIAAKIVLMINQENGWRFLYLFGGIIGILGYYLRRNLVEKITFTTNNSNSVPPIFSYIKNNRKNTLVIVGINIFSSVLICMLSVFTGLYLFRIGLQYDKSLVFSSFGLFLLMLLAPVFGKFSDYIGQKRIMKFSAFCSIVLSVPIFYFLASGSTGGIILGITILGFITASFSGLINTAIAKIIPLKERCSNMALLHNLAMGIFGGITPALCFYIIDRSKENLMPGFYLMAISIVGYIATCCLKDR